MILNFSANKARVKTIGWHLLFWLIYIVYEEVLVLYAKQPAEPFNTLYSFLINAMVFYNFCLCIRYLTKKIKNIFVLILAILIAASAIIAITAFFKILGDAIILNVSFKVHAPPFRLMALIVQTIYFGGMGAAYSFAKALIQKKREAAHKNSIIINKAQSNGIGLNFIRERLTDEYGREGYELLINETDNTYECKLIMPLKYPENHTDVILKADRNPVINQKPIYV